MKEDLVPPSRAVAAAKEAEPPTYALAVVVASHDRKGRERFSWRCVCGLAAGAWPDEEAARLNARRHEAEWAKNPRHTSLAKPRAYASAPIPSPSVSQRES